MNDELDPLENRLRAWGDAGRHSAPAVSPADLPVASTPGRGRRTLRLASAVAAAAAVAAVVVTIAATVGRTAPSASPVTVETGTQEPIVTAPDTSTPAAETDPGSSTWSPGAATTGEMSGSLQTVTYRGLQVTVPADWTLDAVHCAAPTADTVVRAQFFLACGYPRTPGVTAAMFVTYSSGGTPVLVPSGPAGPAVDVAGPLEGFRHDSTREEGNERLTETTVYVPSLGVGVTVSSTDPLKVEQVLDTLVAVVSDRNGCASADVVDDLPITTPGTLVQPPSGASAVVCSYQDGSLLDSQALQTQDIAALLDLLVTAPAAQDLDPTSCPPDQPWVSGANHVRLNVGDLSYTVLLHECRLLVSDGQRAVGVSPGLFTFLIDRVAIESGFSQALLVPSAAPTT